MRRRGSSAGGGGGASRRRRRPCNSPPRGAVRRGSPPPPAPARRRQARRTSCKRKCARGRRRPSCRPRPALHSRPTHILQRASRACPQPAGIEDLREKREELNRSILRDEEEKAKIQKVRAGARRGGAGFTRAPVRRPFASGGRAGAASRRGRGHRGGGALHPVVTRPPPACAWWQFLGRRGVAWRARGVRRRATWARVAPRHFRCAGHTWAIMWAATWPG